MSAPLAPPLTYTHRTLDNGLSVYALPDKTTGSVSVQVWYKVGSKDDPANRSGFAHLFEHIMFKATRNMPAEFFDRLTEDVGGFNNASTYDDFTNYYEVVPANHLERILWAEAERMGALVVDEDIFNAERDVVIEEFRQRIYASPYGRLYGLYLAQINYDVHPYGRPGIGSIEDLEASTIDDVRAFHAAYYRPDNAVLVVSGAYDENDLNKWVEQYFGVIPKPSAPIHKLKTQEPPRTAAKDFTTFAPNVPLPAVAISWPGMAGSDPDLAALSVLDAILARGESSRFYQSIVYEQQLAVEAFTLFEPTVDPSAYTVSAILSEGKSVEDGVRALQAEIDRLKQDGVTPAELSEAKNEIVTEKLEARETAFGRGFELADSVIRFSDADYADELLAQIQNVTSDDITRLAQRLFDDDARTIIRYSDETEANGVSGDAIVTSPSIEAAPLESNGAGAPVFALASENERVQPPAPGQTVTVSIPTPSETVLENGLKVITAQRTGVPLISATLRIAAGGASDPDNLAGLADMTAALAPKGTSTRSAVDIAQAIEQLGASLSSGADKDSSSVSLLTRTDNKDAAFEIFSDTIKNPVFDDEEVERQRRMALDEFVVSLGEPSAVAARVMARAIYQDAPYGRLITERSLNALNRDAAAQFHATHWGPEQSVLVVTGDVTAEDGVSLAQKYFADWRVASGQKLSPPDNSSANAPRVLVVDMPDAGQAAVYAGVVATARNHDDFLPALLATNVLGGGYSARLNMEIRVKRGLSYGAGASLPARLGLAPIVAGAQTRNDAAFEVMEIIRAEMEKIGQDTISAEELEARKAVLAGQFSRNVETGGGLGDQLSNIALFGLPLSSLSSLISDVERVSIDDVQRVAREYLNPHNASYVIVGSANSFIDSLRAQYPQTELATLDQLDFDSEKLI